MYYLFQTAIPIPSPCNGVIEARLVEDGTTVKPGMELFKINCGGSGGKYSFVFQDVKRLDVKTFDLSQKTFDLPIWCLKLNKIECNCLKELERLLRHLLRHLLKLKLHRHLHHQVQQPLLVSKDFFFYFK